MSKEVREGTLTMFMLNYGLDYMKAYFEVYTFKGIIRHSFVTIVLLIV